MEMTQTKYHKRKGTQNIQWKGHTHTYTVYNTRRHTQTGNSSFVFLFPQIPAALPTHQTDC